jgi:hypothetical protein
MTTSTSHFFPTTESAQIIWLTHYALQLPVNGPTCGIVNEEITNTQTDITSYVFMLQQWHPASQRDGKEFTAHKQLMIFGSGSVPLPYPQPTLFPNPPPASIPGIQKRLFSQIARIKASLNYTEVIGKDLGIIAIPDTVEHPVPEFWLTAELGLETPQVRIDFTKYGHEGIWIESRINEGDWAFLAIDTVKPYLDKRPLIAGNTLETREYRMRWWDKSEAHGEWTGVQKAILGV